MSAALPLSPPACPIDREALEMLLLVWALRQRYELMLYYLALE